MKKILSLLLSVAALNIQSNAQKLSKFGADLGKKSVMGKEIRVPYTSMVSYFGYVGGDSKPDEEKGGKKYYYVYAWIPLAAPELGIRMISPVPDSEKPSETDFQSPAYQSNSSDKASYFDTWISFDRAIGVVSSADISKKGKSATWATIEKNDDIGEMPANPGSSKYNSLMRLIGDAGDPLKSLTVGLYRIVFTTYKTGDVKGSFLAQIGAPISIPGIIVASTLKEVQEKIK